MRKKVPLAPPGNPQCEAQVLDQAWGAHVWEGEVIMGTDIFSSEPGVPFPGVTPLLEESIAEHSARVDGIGMGDHLLRTVM